MAAIAAYQYLKGRPVSITTHNFGKFWKHIIGCYYSVRGRDQKVQFVHTWRLALASSVSLPPTDDPAYASLGALGRHVLSAAGGYMIWMCEVLALPDPGIRSAPDAAAIVRDADDYMEHVLERWRAPLKEVSNERLENSRVPIAMADALLYRSCSGRASTALP